MKALDEDQCLEAFYNGVPPSKIYAPNVNVQYNEQAQKLGLELILEQPIFTKEWLMPAEYKDMGLLDFFADKVTTEEQLVRIAEELKLFIDTDNENLLRYLVYLGNLIKEN